MKEKIYQKPSINKCYEINLEQLILVGTRAGKHTGEDLKDAGEWSTEYPNTNDNYLSPWDGTWQ